MFSSTTWILGFFSSMTLIAAFGLVPSASVRACMRSVTTPGAPVAGAAAAGVLPGAAAAGLVAAAAGAVVAAAAGAVVAAAAGAAAGLVGSAAAGLGASVGLAGGW